MKCKVTTYKTLHGTKEILEPKKKKNTQWIIYQDNNPKYLIDLFDLRTESNVILNSLIFCAKKRSITEILKIINKKNNVNLSVPKLPLFQVKVKSEYKELELESIPEEWVSYSL